MDVHGGKGVQDGPHNYLGTSYRSVPIGITVEGANIVTRSLIQFGQGAIRSHPYLLKEMAALEDPDRARGLEAFDRDFWAHVGHSVINALRAWGRAWSGAMFAPAPAAGQASRFYRPLGRYASAFALAVDVALLSLGGALKRQEMISARFGDVLSELYLLSAVLKRFEDEGRQEADLPLVAWCMQRGFATIEARLDEIYANFPNRPAAWLLRFLTLPFGAHRRGPSDRLTRGLRRHPAQSRRPRAIASPSISSTASATTGWRGSSAPSRLSPRPSRCASACAARACATSTRRNGRR